MISGEKNREKPKKNPYEDLPQRAFWRPSVADRSMFDIQHLWTPKFKIDSKSPVVTFGSCFAQHIGSALKQRGYNWLITETPPAGMRDEGTKAFNYNVFSARTANIYTTSLLLQWVKWALNEDTPPDEYWIRDGRIYDPFRPAIEPNGFKDVDEMVQSRNEAIKSFSACIHKAKFFVFTLGLTESWFNVQGNYEYPMCPGTIVGDFDGENHVFINQNFDQVKSKLLEAISLIRRANTRIKFILTVSPVPLTATKSGNHVLVATMYSKSVLRTVAGQLADRHKFIDYFPSYEIINSAAYRGTFFDPNMRSVNIRGVNFVMDNFFDDMLRTFGSDVDQIDKKDIKKGPNAEICEEQILAAFSS